MIQSGLNGNSKEEWEALRGTNPRYQSVGLLAALGSNVAQDNHITRSDPRPHMPPNMNDDPLPPQRQPPNVRPVTAGICRHLRLGASISKEVNTRVEPARAKARLPSI